VNTPAVVLLVALGQLLGSDGERTSTGRANLGSTAAVGGTAMRAFELEQEPRPAVGRALQQVQFDAARFDSATASALRGILDSAVERGLPSQPLINTALEGSARRVHGTRILAAVRAHAAALETSRDLLGAESTNDELNEGASALRSGIDPKVLVAIRATRPAGTAVMPLMVLTDIVRRGVPMATARDAVTSIARMPRSDDALLGLQVTVARNSVRGPGMAVDALNRYLRGTVQGSNPPSAPATGDRKPIRPPSS